MSASDPLLMQAISLRSRWLQTRHAILTENVANADTPGFKPNDLQESSFARLIDAAAPSRPGVEVARTDAGHMTASGAPARVDGRREVDGFETAPAGNAVVLEEEAYRLADTRAQYQLATGLYGKFVGLFRTALGSPGG